MSITALKVTIAIASTNPVKVQAVKEVFPEASTTACAVASGVDKQPIGLESIINGAKIRALNAFDQYDYSIGIESGIMKLPTEDEDFVDLCCCSIFDGTAHHLGFSCAFRVPPAAITHIREHNSDLQQAIHAIGITENPKLGASEGLIGLLTKGAINRKEYTKQAVVNALVSLNYPELF